MRYVFACLLAALVLVAPRLADASSHGPPAAEAAEPAEKPTPLAELPLAIGEEVEHHGDFLLGEFFLSNLRSPERTRVKIGFVLYAVVSESYAERFPRMVRQHRHRIRDQVITVMRMAEREDLDEPDLYRLRRRLLLRLQRTLPELPIQQVLFGEFRYLEE